MAEVVRSIEQREPRPVASAPNYRLVEVALLRLHAGPLLILLILIAVVGALQFRDGHSTLTLIVASR